MKSHSANLLALIAALGLGGAAMAQTGTGGTTVVPQQQPSTTGTATGQSATADTAMKAGLLASSLIGMTVYSTSGEQIGEVNDIVVQPQTGQANTAIIGVGGFLGIGEKDVAIDMAQLQMLRETDDATPRLTLNTTKDQLTAAPAFDRSALRGQATGSTTGSTTGTTGGTQTQQPQQ